MQKIIDIDVPKSTASENFMHVLPGFFFVDVRSGNQHEQLNFTPSLSPLISGRLHQFPVRNVGSGKLLKVPGKEPAQSFKESH